MWGQTLASTLYLSSSNTDKHPLRMPWYYKNWSEHEALLASPSAMWVLKWMLTMLWRVQFPSAGNNVTVCGARGFWASPCTLPSKTTVGNVEEWLSFSLEDPLLKIMLGLCCCLVVEIHLHLPILRSGVSGALLPPLLTLACCPLTLVAYRLQSACHGRARPFHTITTLGQS